MTVKQTINNPSCVQLLKMFDVRGDRPWERVEVTAKDAEGREYTVRGRITCADITTCEDDPMRYADYVKFGKCCMRGDNSSGLWYSEKVMLPLSSRAYIEVQPEGSTIQRVSKACLKSKFLETFCKETKEFSRPATVKDLAFVDELHAPEPLIIDQENISRISVFEDPSSFTEVSLTEPEKQVIAYPALKKLFRAITEDNFEGRFELKRFQDDVRKHLKNPRVQLEVAETLYPAILGGRILKLRGWNEEEVVVDKDPQRTYPIRGISALRIITRTPMESVNTMRTEERHLVADPLSSVGEDARFIELQGAVVDPSLEELEALKQNGLEVSFLMRDYSVLRGTISDIRPKCFGNKVSISLSNAKADGPSLWRGYVAEIIAIGKIGNEMHANLEKVVRAEKTLTTAPGKFSPSAGGEPSVAEERPLPLPEPVEAHPTSKLKKEKEEIFFNASMFI